MRYEYRSADLAGHDIYDSIEDVLDALNRSGFKYAGSTARIERRSVDDWAEVPLGPVGDETPQPTCEHGWTGPHKWNPEGTYSNTIWQSCPGPRCEHGRNRAHVAHVEKFGTGQIYDVACPGPVGDVTPKAACERSNQEECAHVWPGSHPGVLSRLAPGGAEAPCDRDARAGSASPPGRPRLTEAKCTACGKWIKVRNNGTLYGHGARDVYQNWCPGSSLPGVDPRPRARHTFDPDERDEGEA